MEPFRTALGAVTLLVATCGVARAKDEPLPPGRLERIATATLPAGVSGPRLATLKQVRDSLRGPAEPASKAWAEWSAGYFTKANRGDLPAIEDWLLREAFVEPEPALAPLARRVRFHAERRDAVKRHVAELRRQLRALRDEKSTASVAGLQVAEKSEEGKPAATPLPARLLTKSTIETEIQAWEEKLNSIGDDAQLANVDLQNTLQKQQQTLQMMSNISKMLHDTAMAVIRKIGG
jgi:hypothetical protein